MPPQGGAFFIATVALAVVVRRQAMAVGQRKIEWDGNGTEEGIDISCCEVLGATTTEAPRCVLG
jgi:hypothetical protein